MISECRFQIADWWVRTAAALLACCAVVLAYSGGPPNGKTGRPGEGTCNDCHSGLGSADSTELLGFAGGSYQPDSLYTLTLSVRYTGQRRWGFELTAVDATNARAGQLSLSDSVGTQYSNAGPGYVKQTGAGTYPGTPGPTSWSFRWRAPAAGTGVVRFYWCTNAADNTGGTSGDRICRDSLTLSETGIAEPGKVVNRRFWRYANPARNRVVILYRGSAESPARVYAASGLLVRSLAPERDCEMLRVVWDGRDESGRVVPAASYFVRLGEEISSVARIQLVR